MTKSTVWGVDVTFTSQTPAEMWNTWASCALRSRQSRRIRVGFQKLYSLLWWSADGQWSGAETDSALEETSITSVLVWVTVSSSWASHSIWLFPLQTSFTVLMCEFSYRAWCCVKKHSQADDWCGARIAFFTRHFPILQSGALISSIDSVKIPGAGERLFCSWKCFRTRCSHFICEENSVWQVVLIICIKSVKGAHLCLQQQPGGVIT